MSAEALIADDDDEEEDGVQINKRVMAGHQEQSAGSSSGWSGCNLGSVLTCSKADFAQKLSAKLRSLNLGKTDGLVDSSSEAITAYQSMAQTNPLWATKDTEGVVTAASLPKTQQNGRVSKGSVSSDGADYGEYDLDSPGSPAGDVTDLINPFDDLKHFNCKTNGQHVEPQTAPLQDETDCTKEMTDLPLESQEQTSSVLTMDGFFDTSADHTTGSENVSSNSTSKETMPTVADVELPCPPKLEIHICTDSSALTEGAPYESTSAEDEERPVRVMRSSSLKTGKTPPGTPGRKKIVRFADALGLDLADIRTFLDDVPNVPKSAYVDLSDVEDECPIPAYQPPPVPRKALVPMFHQPGVCSDFLDRIRERRVCLENAFMSEDMAVSGTVRVLNMDFHKSVHIRYSTDNWGHFSDLQANYVSGSCDGFSDRFSFLIYAHMLDVGQRLTFAVRFHCKGQQFWDNNGGSDYVFECISTQSNPGSCVAMTTTSPDDPWMRFI